ncbi:MAG: hypothetical protein ACO3UU_15670, partial [Minisyncoccia bacterium]
CASSPGLGRQFHQYIPHIKDKVAKLREVAKSKDIEEYYKKIYNKANPTIIKELTNEYVSQQKRKVYLAEKFPEIKLEDIEVLNKIITNVEIKQYEHDSGNE